MKLIPIFIIFLLLPTIVFADAKSDYDYQYTRYRDSYQEFIIFKKDYLDTPSLDNQQKVLLSLKQSLSHAICQVFACLVSIRLINLNKVKYKPLDPILTMLSDARLYYLAKANEAQTVVTLSNLKEYDKSYLETSTNQKELFVLA